MPWLVCVQKDIGFTRSKDRLFYLGEDNVITIKDRKHARSKQLIDKKLYWDKNVLKAKTYGNRRQAAREAGRFKKSGGAKAFWMDDAEYAKLIVDMVHV